MSWARLGAPFGMIVLALDAAPRGCAASGRLDRGMGVGPTLAAMKKLLMLIILVALVAMAAKKLQDA